MPAMKLSQLMNEKQRVMIGGVGVLIVVLALLRWLYAPAVGRLRARWDALRDLNTQIAGARALAAQPQDEELAARRLQARRRALEGRIGRDQSVARILEELRLQATHHQLGIVVLQHHSENEPQSRLVRLGPSLPMREIPLHVQVTGRYRQIAEFLGELPAAPFVAAVKTMTLTKPQVESGRLQADLDCTVYLAEGALPT